MFVPQRQRRKDGEMIPEINYWAVLIATASTMAVGATWYAPKVFGNRWAKLAKVPLPGPDQKGGAAPLVITMIVTLVTAWVQAGATTIAWAFYGGSYFWSAIVTAVILWAGFTAARFITHDAFEGRPWQLTVINITHELVTFVVMAVIIGVWPPAGTV